MYLPNAHKLILIFFAKTVAAIGIEGNIDVTFLKCPQPKIYVYYYFSDEKFKWLKDVYCETE